MNIDEYPKLITVNKLLRPFVLQLKELEDISTDLDKGGSKTLIRGAFVLAAASAETALADSLKCYLIHFPHKMKDEFKYSKDEWFENLFRLVSVSAEKKVTALLYKPFPDFFDSFLEILSIDREPAYDNAKVVIQEIRATRNLLLHNNLIVNDAYIDQAGDCKRMSRIDEVLPLNLAYAKKAIRVLTEFLNGLKSSIEKKYASYTKDAACRRLWDFLFECDRLKYDDFWSSEDGHIYIKKGKCEDGMGTGERILLGVWRTHFAGNASHLSCFDMRSLDRKHKEKLLFLLSIASDFKFD